MIKDKNIGIYKIQSLNISDRIYIGSSINIKNRWTDHRKRLRSNTHENTKIQRHYNKYGESDLIFTILENCDPNELLTKEQFYIDLYNPYFNICKLVVAGRLGEHVSNETKLKISNSHKGKILSDIHKKRIGISLMDKTIYKFYHISYGYIECTQNELKKKHNIHSGNLSKLCDGRQNKLKGWVLLNNF